MKHSISFYTLGCKVNQSDTASMEKLFREAGYEIVPFGEASDISHQYLRRHQYGAGEIPAHDPPYHQT